MAMMIMMMMTMTMMMMMTRRMMMMTVSMEHSLLSYYLNHYDVGDNGSDKPLVVGGCGNDQ
jgi:hypothetical protein